MRIAGKMVPKGDLAIWWAVRLSLFGALIYCIFFDKENINQMLFNLIFTFTWSVVQYIPFIKKVKHITFRLQTIFTVHIFFTTIFGAFFDFYYTVFWWDKLMHFVGCGLVVIAGYELFHILHDDEEKPLQANIAILGGFSFSFLTAVIWEIFEFGYDHILGADTQHWMLAAGEEIPRGIFRTTAERFALMDTMEDLIIGTLGSLVFAGVLLAYPYINRRKEQANAKAKREQEELRAREAIVFKK